MRDTGGKSRILAACCIAIVVLAVQGCRKEEQGRILNYKKGTYLGKSDTQLTPAQKEALRHRTSLQGQQ